LGEEKSGFVWHRRYRRMP